MSGAIKLTPLHKTRQETTLEVYVLTVPSHFYDSEYWILTKKLQQTKVTETRFFSTERGYRRIGRRRNKIIRQELNIFDIRNNYECRRNYYEHISTMPIDRIPRKLCDYQPKV
jgi:hypothetical protein